MPETHRDRSVAFFLEHAGWNYQPETETPEQGRYRCAVALAEAEAWARDAGVTFEWEDDWMTDHDYSDEDPETCEMVALFLAGQVLASLGCVDDATPEYRRVIEAELASEALCDLEQSYARAYVLAWAKVPA